MLFYFRLCEITRHSMSVLSSLIWCVAPNTKSKEFVFFFPFLFFIFFFNIRRTHSSCTLRTHTCARIQSYDFSFSYYKALHTQQPDDICFFGIFGFATRKLSFYVATTMIFFFVFYRSTLIFRLSLEITYK